MGIFVSLQGILACLLQGIWDILYPPIQASFIYKDTLILNFYDVYGIGWETTLKYIININDTCMFVRVSVCK